MKRIVAAVSIAAALALISAFGEETKKQADVVVTKAPAEKASPAFGYRTERSVVVENTTTNVVTVTVPFRVLEEGPLKRVTVQRQAVGCSTQVVMKTTTTVAKVPYAKEGLVDRLKFWWYTPKG